MHRLSSVRDYSLIIAAAALAAGLAAYFGWLNVDAWNYIALADNMMAGNGLSIRPSWGETYWAIFPLGYPYAISMLKVFLPLDTVIVSKILNAFLLVVTIRIAASLTRLPLLLVAALFLSSAWLEVASYSWSENLFVCALLAALLALDRFLETGRKRWVALYAFALIISIASRYIGGFYLVAYGVIIIWYASRMPSSRIVIAMMATAVAAVFFVGYLAINREITGHLTGFGRAPATESLWVLVSAFGSQSLVTSLLLLLPPLLLLLAYAQPRRAQQYGELPASIIPMVIAGIIYLGLLFALRMHSRFELFGNRMVIPGLLLLALAAIAALYHRVLILLPEKKRMLEALLFVAAFVASLGLLYKQMLAPGANWQHESLKASMERYDASYGALKEGTAIIEPSYPISGWRIDTPAFTSNKVFLVQTQDYPFKLDTYRSFLSQLRYKGTVPKYVFDFEEFGTIEELEQVMAVRVADPALAGWIKAHFSPNRFVPCHDCRPTQ
jgi:hypothetical protein